METKKLLLFIFGIFFFFFLVFYNLKYILKARGTTPELNIKIKLQGDYSHSKNLILKTKIALYTPYVKVTELTGQPLTQLDGNIFGIKMPLSGFDLTQTYSFFIKPEKYIGRISPKYILTNSQNKIDFTDQFFYAGDIVPADGKVSSYDISKIIGNLGKTEKQTRETDVNSNGITNTQDYAITLYALSQNAVDDKIILLPTITPTLKPKATPIPNKKPTSLPTTTQTIPTQTPGPTVVTSVTIAPGSGCPTMNNSLPNSTMHYPSGSTTIPQTTKEVCATNKTSYFSLPYRNPNCLATESGIKKAYERMRTYYPAYFPQTKLLTDWKTVQTYAQKYNFNPLFVIAVWIEESAAGGATAAQQLGCLYRLNKDDTFTFLSASSNICEQMECFFGRRSVVPENFGLWACQYQHGASQWQTDHCLKVVNFADGVEFWYNYIAQNLSSNCQIKYYSGSDPGCQQ